MFFWCLLSAGEASGTFWMSRDSRSKEETGEGTDAGVGWESERGERASHWPLEETGQSIDYTPLMTRGRGDIMCRSYIITLMHIYIHTYHCNGLRLCPWLRPLLPLRLLLPSVGFGSTLGAAFCCEQCEGRAFGPSGPFSYYAAKGLLCCGSISTEWPSLLISHPSKFYISLKSFFFVHDLAGSASE